MNRWERFLKWTAIVGIPLIFVYPVALQFTPFIFYENGDKWVSFFNPGRHTNIEHGRTCASSGAPCRESFILDGPIWNGAAKKFVTRMDKLTKNYPNVNLICLNSSGGLNVEGAKIAAYIRDHKLNTCVGDMPISDNAPKNPDFRFTANCSSACTMIVLAGVKRIAIGNQFTFGLHASSSVISDVDVETESSIIAANDALLLYSPYVSITLLQLDKIILATRRTPAARMYFATEREQAELGFFTERLIVTPQ